MNNKAITKPFLKWVGGKSKVLPQLRDFFPANFNVYFEPFVGGGAVFFGIVVTKATINDINESLIGAYVNVRDNVDLLIKSLQTIQAAYYKLDPDLQKDMFYKFRDEYNQLQDKNALRKSSLLIFLNKTCFNGMYRENRSGGFNVPFGKHTHPTICDENSLRQVSSFLQKTKILSGSYNDALVSAKGGDFVYLDPPYYPLNKTSSFTSYSEGDFLEKEQIELKACFDALTKKGCKVMMSNSNTEFIRELYKEYRQESVMVARSINANGSGRSKISEIVVLNY
jgi:DNA adenine methylase